MIMPNTRNRIVYFTGAAALTLALSTPVLSDGPVPYETTAIHYVNDSAVQTGTTRDLNQFLDMTTDTRQLAFLPERDREGEMWTYADRTGRVRSLVDVPLSGRPIYNNQILDTVEVPPQFRNTLVWGKTFIKGTDNQPTKATILPSQLRLYTYLTFGDPGEDFTWPYVDMMIEISVSHVARLEGVRWELLDNITKRRVFFQRAYIIGYANRPFDALSSTSTGKMSVQFYTIENGPTPIQAIDLDRYVHEFDLSHIGEGDLFRIEYTLLTEAMVPSDMSGYAYLADPLGSDGNDSGIALEIPHQEYLDDDIPRSCGDVFDTSRYLDHGNGSVTDRVTGLMWQRCPVGFDFSDGGTPADMSDDTCDPDGSQATGDWQRALQRGGESTLGGYADWRSPNVKELETLVASCIAPSIEANAFPDTPLNRAFWSSTPDYNPTTNALNAWQVDFSFGDIRSTDKVDFAYVRLVRDDSNGPLESLPALIAGRGEISESDTGPSELRIPVELSEPASGRVTVNYSVSDLDGSATAGSDFDAIADTLIFPVGTTRQEIVVTVQSDAEVEGDETVALQLSDNSANSRIAVARSLSTIRDNSPVLQFARYRTKAVEGDSNENPVLQVPVLLDRPAVNTVTVDYVLDDDTAAVGIDVVAAAGTLVFNAGEQVATIELTSIGDDLMEPDETANITLSNPSGAKLAPGSDGVMTQTIVLLDDDGPGSYAALNDTAVQVCANDVSATAGCPQNGFPGQDGEFGRDADPATNGNGDGLAGFSFTKLDANGNALVNQGGSYFTNPWSCAVDEVTGLVWEVKSLFINDPIEDNDLHSARWTYTWYNSTGLSDGGDAGTENGGSCIDADNCDTEKYIAAVNAENYCGFSDWRLPTIDELYTIVDNRNASLRHDTTYFPNTTLGNSGTGQTWSSTPGSDKFGNGGQAWSLSANGVSTQQKLRAQSIRLVRGGN